MNAKKSRLVFPAAAVRLVWPAQILIGDAPSRVLNMHQKTSHQCRAQITPDILCHWHPINRGALRLLSNCFTISLRPSRICLFSMMQLNKISSHILNFGCEGLCESCFRGVKPRACSEFPFAKSLQLDKSGQPFNNSSSGHFPCWENFLSCLYQHMQLEGCRALVAWCMQGVTSFCPPSLQTAGLTLNIAKQDERGMSAGPQPSAFSGRCFAPPHLCPSWPTIKPFLRSQQLSGQIQYGEA